jgi:hypothetical protein
MPKSTERDEALGGVYGKVQIIATPSEEKK